MDLTTYDWSGIDKNLIVQIALELNLPSILSLCQTNKRFNLTVCESENFWYRKIIKDYDFKPNEVKNAKEYYQIIKDNWDEWDLGMLKAVNGGYQDLVEFFSQKGADLWDEGMYEAARSGHKDLVNFFIQKGACYWEFGRLAAELGGHEDLIEFFEKKIAESK